MDRFYDAWKPHEYIQVTNQMTFFEIAWYKTIVIMFNITMNKQREGVKTYCCVEWTSGVICLASSSFVSILFTQKYHYTLPLT